jgi:hypothetical protein
MFLITPVEIGPGFVIGKKRVVSRVKWTFDVPSAPYDTLGNIGGSTRKVVPICQNASYARPVMVHYFGTGGFRTRVESLALQGARRRWG